MNDIKQHAATIDCFEYVSGLVRRYAEIERIYLQDEGLTLRKELKATLTKLYSQILEYQARAACRFNRNTSLQLARNIVSADSWENILGGMKAFETHCDRLRGKIDTKYQKEVPS